MSKPGKALWLGFFLLGFNVVLFMTHYRTRVRVKESRLDIQTLSSFKQAVVSDASKLTLVSHSSKQAQETKSVPGSQGIKSTALISHPERHQRVKCKQCVDIEPFKPIITPAVAEGRLDFVILILTQFGDVAFQRRQVIRKTWANKKNFAPLKGEYFFAIGKWTQVVLFICHLFLPFSVCVLLKLYFSFL